MLKDLYEDIKRHKSDNRENNGKTLVGKQFKKKKKMQHEAEVEKRVANQKAHLARQKMK